MIFFRGFCTLFSCILLSWVSFAQDSFVIGGKVIDGSTNLPLSGAEVRSANLNVKTDGNGNFSLAISGKEKVEISAPLFHFQHIPIDRIDRDGKQIIYLTPKPESEGLARSESAELAFDPDFENIADYSFLGDELYVLSYMKRNLSARKSRVGGIDFENCAVSAYRFGTRIGRVILPDYSRSLRKMPWNEIYVEGKEFARKIVRTQTGLKAEEVPHEDFLWNVLPLTAATGNTLFYVGIPEKLPLVLYYAHSMSDSTTVLIREIKNSAYFERIPGDYQMLTKAQVEDARELGEKHNMNHQLFAPYLRSLEIAIDLTKPYAPAYTKNNMLYIFDPMNSWIFKHDMKGDEIGSVPMYINFDKEKLISILQDNVTLKFYCVHEKSGVFYIRPLNENTGAAGKPIKLAYPFARNIQVNQGYAYFVSSAGNNSAPEKLYRQSIEMGSTGLE